VQLLCLLNKIYRNTCSFFTKGEPLPQCYPAGGLFDTGRLMAVPGMEMMLQVLYNTRTGTGCWLGTGF